MNVISNGEQLHRLTPAIKISRINFVLAKITLILSIQKLKSVLTSQKNPVEQTFLFVSLKIFNLLGLEAAILVNEQFKPETYEVEWDGSNFPGGVYFYNLIIGGKIINNPEHSWVLLIVFLGILFENSLINSGDFNS